MRELDERLGCGKLIAQHLTDSRQALEERVVKYAIRIPANENLERDIAELLTRPVGRPSRKPVVW